MPIASINPATNEVLEEFEPHGPVEIEQKLRRAAEAFSSYRRSTFAERARCMVRAAEILENERESLGRTISLEMGKPIKAAREEAEKCAWTCRFYAQHAERMLADEMVATSASRSWISYQPLGTVLAIMPWNFPFWQVFRFAAPALMAGNVGLLKHASNVPRCALAIEDILLRAGFGHGVFQTLLVGSGAVEEILRDGRVAAATLTGSEQAGASVGSIAGGGIKKTVLELGGSDPFIVMPSADLEQAVRIGIKARTINNGQSCIAAKRFIVHEQIAEEFERRFVELMEALRVGDPMDESTDVGPLATPEILCDVEEQVRRTVEAGARVITGGRRLERPGNWYAPTVIVDIPRDSVGYREEVFGPVAMLFRVADFDAAINLANDTGFGLGSSVWTHDVDEQTRAIAALDAGMVFVNAMVASDPRLPFGGVKRSGHGRELSEFGIREFVNIKTVWIGGVERGSAE